jgi:hypothetical protein
LGRKGSLKEEFFSEINKGNEGIIIKDLLG